MCNKQLRSRSTFGVEIKMWTKLIKYLHKNLNSLIKFCKSSIKIIKLKFYIRRVETI